MVTETESVYTSIASLLTYLIIKHNTWHVQTAALEGTDKTYPANRTPLSSSSTLLAHGDVIAGLKSDSSRIITQDADLVLHIS